MPPFNSLTTMPDKTAIIEALKEGKIFKAYCAEDDFWRSWEYDHAERDVMSCRGWGKTGNGADFISPALAACEILTCAKSVRFKTNCPSISF
jgi:hypothetical protein